MLQETAVEDEIDETSSSLGKGVNLEHATLRGLGFFREENSYKLVQLSRLLQCTAGFMQILGKLDTCYSKQP
jgi:hypothetical protein